MTRCELVLGLRECADWAEANEYETPIMLSDYLKAAADEIAGFPKNYSTEGRLYGGYLRVGEGCDVNACLEELLKQVKSAAEAGNWDMEKAKEEIQISIIGAPPKVMMWKLRI